MAVRKIFTTTKRTGAGTDSGAADSVSAMTAISKDVATDGAMCLIMEDDGSGFYGYLYDAAGTDATSAPDTYRPNDYTVAGNWKLQQSPFGEFFPIVTSTVPIKGDIRGGDVTVSGQTLTIAPCSCKDSTGATRLYTGTNKTVVLAGTANQIFHVFMVRLVADGSVEFRAYTTEGAVESDAEVDAWRWRTFAINNGSGVTFAHVVKGMLLTFTGTCPTVTSTMNTATSVAASMPPTRVESAFFYFSSASATAVGIRKYDASAVQFSNLCGASYNPSIGEVLVPDSGLLVFYANNTATVLCYAIRLRG